MKTQVFKNYIDFLSREDKSINGVSENFAKENPEYKNHNQENKGCWDCSGCSQ